MSSSSSAAAAAAPSDSEPALTVPDRSPDPPSLYSRTEPDALGLCLSFCLIDLPVALGQPYFPKDLIRIVHEYASDDCFFVVEMSEADENEELRSSSDLLRWIGRHLSDALQLDVYCDFLRGEDVQSLQAHCDSCLRDQELKAEGRTELSRLLHVQLEPNEYRMCYLEIPPKAEGKGNPFDPTEFLDADLDEHDEFCLNELNKRKAAIIARGQTPVAVSVSDLLARVRTPLSSGLLPRGLSPRPCDWGPLLSWISDVEQSREQRRGEDEVFEHHRTSPIAVLNAVRVRRETQGACFRTQCDAELWPKCTVQEPRQSMIVGADGAEEPDEDDDEQSQQGKELEVAQFAAASSSSSSAAAAWSADSEAAARGAARQRCES